MAWKIIDWNGHYENSRSRTIKDSSWVAVPNKHDGKGFAKIAKHPQRCELFSVWVLVVQLASKMPERGLLVDSDGDLTFLDMELKTRFPKKLFEFALPWLEKETGWIINTETVEKYQPDSTVTEAYQETDTQVTDDHQEPDREVRRKGTEGKGTEQNRREGKGTPPLPLLLELWNNAITDPESRLRKCLVEVPSWRKLCEEFGPTRPVSEWELIFKKCAASSFCNGKNDRGWTASFDWLMKDPENAQKVLDGNYEDPPKPQVAPTPEELKERKRARWKGKGLCLECGSAVQPDDAGGNRCDSCLALQPV